MAGLVRGRASGQAESGDETVAGLKAMVEQLAGQVKQLQDEVAELRAARGSGGETSAGAKPASGVEVKMDRKGLQVADRAGGYEISLHGQIQVDGRFPLSDDIDSEDDSTFFVRRARPRINGRLGDFVDFELRWEMSDDVYLTDAWGQLRLAGDAAKLRAGIFKMPFGLDRMMQSSDLWFIERSLTFNLTTGRDLGVELRGSVLGGTMDYEVGVFNGINDGRRSYWEPDTNEGFDFAGWIVGRPFRNWEGSPLAGLALGFSGSVGSEDGDVEDAGGGPVRYRTVARDEFFYLNTENTRYDGERYRWNPQIQYYLGPFGLLAEFMHSKQDYVRGDEVVGQKARTIGTDAWMVEALWVLTGENAGFNGPTPARPFGHGGLGWWGLAARYSSLDTDGGAFEGDPETRLAADGAAGDANAWGLSLIWYPISNFKWMLGFEQTLFNGDAGELGDGDRQTENVIQTRMQVTF